jgi:hypothetical protein
MKSGHPNRNTTTRNIFKEKHVSPPGKYFLGFRASSLKILAFDVFLFGLIPDYSLQGWLPANPVKKYKRKLKQQRK